MTCKWIRVCGLRRLEKKGIISLKWKHEYCESDQKWKQCKRYQLDQQGIPHEDILPNGDKISNQV